MFANRVDLNLSPLGFHGWADLYWQDYETLSGASRDSPVAYLLLCRAMELEFKAWHRQAGKQEVLKDTHGHDLVASYRALPKKHQVLSADEVSVLQQANSFYRKQAFEDAEVSRERLAPLRIRDVGSLRAIAQKVMQHGDRLNLRRW